MRPIFIDELLAECVAGVSTAILSTLQGVNPDIQGIYFKHGHPKEIIAELQAMSKSPDKKNQRYPLVALFRDFPEERGVDAGIYSVPTLNIFVIALSNPVFTSDDRKSKNFMPILYPIIDELFKQIRQSGDFAPGLKSVYQYTQIDHYFWGRESIFGAEANIFTDWIDCIEIKNFKLPIYLNTYRGTQGLLG
jgi:hypothetical protein